MQNLLKIGTVATVTVGPILNVDGTAYVTDNLTDADFLIGKNGVWGALVDTATVAHVANDVQGMFAVTLASLDMGEVGRIEVSPNKATLAGTPFRGTVVTAATYDALLTNAAGAADGLAVSGASKRVAANLTAIDGEANASATLQLKTLQLVNNAQPGSNECSALIIQSGNGDAMRITANDPMNAILINSLVGIYDTPTYKDLMTILKALATTAQLGTKIPQNFQFDSDGTGGYHVRAGVWGFLGTLLTGTGGYIAAAFKKLFDVATPALTAASKDQTGDAYSVVNHADYGNAKLVRSTTPANTLSVDAGGAAKAVDKATGAALATDAHAVAAKDSADAAKVSADAAAAAAAGNVPVNISTSETSIATG